MVDRLGFVSRLADGDESMLQLYTSRCFGALRRSGKVMAALSRLRWLGLPLARTSAVLAPTAVSATPITTSPARRPRRFSCSRHSPLDVPQLASLPTTNFRSPSWRCSLLAGVEILRCCAARTSDHDHYAWVRPRCSPVAGPLTEMLASQSGSDKHICRAGIWW